ncbi:MAG: hypothetical protein IKJ56_11105 [Bacteroidales bacterium]|nr:hypothetical protein [Bacteroidales bacterium]
MKITRENLASEYDSYKSMLKDDEMRSKVRETIDDLLEFYGEDEEITKAVDAIVELVNRYVAKNDKAETDGNADAQKNDNAETDENADAQMDCQQE